MALDSAKISRQRVFAAKAETTTGTAQALAAADGVFNCFDPKMAGEIPPYRRQGQGSLSPLPAAPGARKGKFTFRTELFGSGVSGTPLPPWASTLFPSAGMGITGNVVSFATGVATFPTLTLGHFVAGRLYRLAGAALAWTIKGKNGEPIVIDWNAEGTWQPPIDQAIITPTYPTVNPPLFKGATFTVGGVSYRVSEFELASGNKLYLRADPTDPTGYHGACIVDREPTIKMDPEALPLATQDWFAAHLASTTYAFSCGIGSVGGNIITIAAPSAQVLNVPGIKDRGGIQADELMFQCNRNSAAGDDEVTITFA